MHHVPREASAPLIPTSSQVTHSLTQHSRRTALLNDIIIRTLADDQVLFADGVIMAYHSLADNNALRELCSDDPDPGPLGMMDAVRLLSAVDAGIAWCEGQVAVTAQIFPPMVPRSGTMDRGRSLSNSQRYTETASGNVRGRSRAWPPLSPSPLPPPPPPQQPQHQQQQQAEEEEEEEERQRHMDIGEGQKCHLDFDRWAARLLALRAQCDAKRLCQMRCVAAEAVRRYAIAAEERLGRVTLLVAAHEELSCCALYTDQAGSSLYRDCTTQTGSIPYRDYAAQRGSSLYRDCAAQTVSSLYRDCTTQTGSSLYRDCTTQTGSSLYRDCTTQTGSSLYRDCTAQTGSSLYRDCTTQTGSSLYRDCTTQTVSSLYRDCAAQTGSIPYKDCTTQTLSSLYRDCAAQTDSDRLMWGRSELRCPVRFDTALVLSPSPTAELSVSPGALREAGAFVPPLSAFAEGLLRDGETAGRAGCKDKERLARLLLLAHWDTVLAHASSRRLLVAKEEQIQVAPSQPRVPSGAAAADLAQRICVSVETVERKQIELREQRARQMAHESRVESEDRVR